tara:strand:- start:20288 stop:21136 length:849 start_codon:yes stop_codon:yes gene_type:complete
VEFRQSEPLIETQQKQLDNLRSYFKGLKKVCVAYSGGVDSTLVAAIAKEQLDQDAIAITGVSPALAPHLLQEARQQARWIGIRHQECQTNELKDPSYNKNPENRCFACKRELHNKLQEIEEVAKGVQVVDGVNHDDLNDYRPGIDASSQAGVISPLAELKITKASIRAISKSLGFPWWDKPAQPCLASRFPYGDEITSVRLNQIAQAEEWIIKNGFKKVRVRTQGLGARIELPSDQINDFLENCDRKRIIEHFLSIGFTSVSIDLEGLISGKLNRDIKKPHK